MIKPLLIAALLATGGTQVAAQSLVGKWDCDGRAGPNMAMRTVQSYSSVGSFYHLANIAMGDRKGRRFDMALALQGAWSGEGAVLVEQINTVRVRSVFVNKRDITNTPQGKQMARIMKRQFARPDRPSRIKLDTLTGRKMTFVDGPFTATCTKR